jgi:hypothetical protein
LLLFFGVVSCVLFWSTASAAINDHRSFALCSCFLCALRPNNLLLTESVMTGTQRYVQRAVFVYRSPSPPSLPPHHSIKKQKLMTLMVTAIFDVSTASNVHLSFRRPVIAYTYLYEALSSSMCLSFNR